MIGIFSRRISKKKVNRSGIITAAEVHRLCNAQRCGTA
jgi:hypothetical protein